MFLLFFVSGCDMLGDFNIFFDLDNNQIDIEEKDKKDEEDIKEIEDKDPEEQDPINDDKKDEEPVTKKYTVVFNTNGGIIVTGDAIQIVTDPTEIIIPLFERDGYNYIGTDIDLSCLEEYTIVNVYWEKIESYDENQYLNYYNACKSLSDETISVKANVIAIVGDENANRGS